MVIKLKRGQTFVGQTSLIILVVTFLIVGALIITLMVPGGFSFFKNLPGLFGFGGKNVDNKIIEGASIVRFSLQENALSYRENMIWKFMSEGKTFEKGVSVNKQDLYSSFMNFWYFDREKEIEQSVLVESPTGVKITILGLEKNPYTTSDGKTQRGFFVVSAPSVVGKDGGVDYIVTGTGELYINKKGAQAFTQSNVLSSYELVSPLSNDQVQITAAVNMWKKEILVKPYTFSYSVTGDKKSDYFCIIYLLDDSLAVNLDKPVDKDEVCAI